MDEKITLTKGELVQLVNETATEKANEAVAELQKEVTELKGGVTGGKFSYKGAASGMSEDALGKLETKGRMASFIKAVYHKDAASLSTLKAMTEGTGSAGGFIVPDEFATEVNRVVEDFGLVAKLARKFPMGTDTLYVPRLASSGTVSVPGEATAGTGSQPVFEQFTLAA